MWLNRKAIDVATRQKIELERRRPIAIIRLDDLSEAVNISRALVAGGITALEFTLTNREALQAVRAAREALGSAAQVGAGTVTTVDDARAAIEAGSEFLVTPVMLPDVIAVAREANIVIMCGAFSPTEIWTAWQHGADFVKVFPARSLGPSYLKDVLAPLPDLRLVPTGGVSMDNCAAFLKAGAYTVALGSNLVDKDVIRRKDWAALTETARQHVAACGVQQ